jgi:hypothetical protein
MIDEPTPIPPSREGLHRGVHLQAAAEIEDKPERDALLASGVLASIFMTAVIYYLWNYRIPTHYLDELFLAFVFIVSLPWLRLMMQALGNIERRGRRRDALVWFLERSIERDIDGDGIIGQPWPQHWLSDYYSELLTRGVSTGKDQALAMGLSYSQWSAARDTLIATGLAVKTGNKKGQKSFILARLSLAEIAQRMPDTPPDVSPYLIGIEGASKMPTVEAIKKRVRGA